MKKRVAIPVTGENLSEYFGECSFYEIFEIDGNVTHKWEVRIPEGISVAELPEWLQKMEITDVIAFKISPKLIHLFASRKVNLFVGVPIDSPSKLIDEYLKGKLESDENIIREITLITSK
jgi:predicted Fe-Mo cluster-binding NifX family protein